MSWAELVSVLCGWKEVILKSIILQEVKFLIISDEEV